MKDNAQLSLIESIYDSALDSSRWQAFLDRMMMVFDAMGTTLLIRGNSSDGLVELWHSGYGDRCAREYVEHYYRHDIFHDVIHTKPTGTGIRTAAITDTSEGRSSIFFNEWMRPHDAMDGLGGVVFNEVPRSTVMSLFRPRSAGVASDKQYRLFMSLIPHVHRSLTIQRHLSRDIQARDAAVRSLDSLAAPMALVAADGHLLFATPAAEAILKSPGPLSAAAGRLKCRDAADQDVLKSLIWNAAQTAGGHAAHPGGVLRLSAGTSQPVAVLISPFRSPGCPAGGGMSLAIVLIKDPELIRRTLPERLAPLFGLTVMEARLTAALAAGDSLEEFATQQKMSIQTARTHLQRIFGKTGTCRQGGLIALALRT